MNVAFDWPIYPIATAPRDRRICVWVPGNRFVPGQWMFARWFEDERPGSDMSSQRWELMQRHGGYWSAHRLGGNPMRRAPTLWVDLPNPREAA